MPLNRIQPQCGKRSETAVTIRKMPLMIRNIAISKVSVSIAMPGLATIMNPMTT